MKHDSRLSSTLHALLHLAQHRGPMTSEAIARCLGTNPVVVRRNMGLLRNAGLVSAGRGHSGGWRLAVDPSAITLRHLHDALGEPAILAVGHRQAMPVCLVEQSVNAALDQGFAEAEALLLDRFSRVTLADLAADIARRQTGAA